MEKTKIQNRKRERVALDFNGKTSLVEKRRWMERCIWKLMDKLGISSPLILETNCSDGRDTEIFLQRGARVVSICSSKKRLEFARTRAPEAEFYLSDVKLKSETVDAVWCMNLMDFLSPDDMSKIFTNFSRVLKPKGLIGFNGINKSETEKLIHQFEILEKEPYPEEFFKTELYQVIARKL